MTISLSAPSTLHGTILLPTSKSISNRALIIHALSHSDAQLHDLSDCDDTEVIVKAFRERPSTIDIGAAGTAMRFLTAYLSVTPGKHTLTGSERMRHRPIGVLVEALRSLGASIAYEKVEGFPPLYIEGRTLQGGEISLPGNVSSQYISALLLVAPTLAQGLTLRLKGDIISRPYIDLSLSLMRIFGASCRWTDERTLRVNPGGYKATDYAIEPDFSAASYWYELVALAPDDEAKIFLPKLTAESLQGDSKIAEYFEQLGVKSSFTTEGAWIEKSGKPTNKFELDLRCQPDLAQTLVVTCAALRVPFRFSGLQTLRIKETDRLTALQTELKKLGYPINIEGNEALSWDGTLCPQQTQPAIDTYADHRMAMSFAPCAFRFQQLKINEPQVVSKSYPHFWDDLQSVGFNLSNVE